MNTNTISKEKLNIRSNDPIKNWVYQMQHTSGLLESAEETNFVSLYDNALAAIFFIHDNQKEKAEGILNFYYSKINEEVLVNGGFYQTRNIDGEEAETLWMGDNAWLLIAINHYSDTYNSSKYDVLGKHLENWLRSLQDKDGGLKGGIRADGTEMPKITEGMLTAFNAVKGYDDFHINILKFLQNERWDAKNMVLMAWPENPKYAYAMDIHSLSSGILPGMSENVLLEANRYLNQQKTQVNGETLTGYSFDEDKDVVWLEGTAQMAVAFQSVGQTEKTAEIINELEKTFIQSTSITNAKGIPYTSNHGTSYGSTVLWDHADIAPALSSTIWYLFAKEHFNPLALGKKSNIPEIQKFWIQNSIN